MSDFFIKWAERLAVIFVIMIVIAVIVAAVATMMQPAQGGLLAGLGILVVGTMYSIIIGGFMFMGFGIYRNTKRTAELLEHIANK